MGDIVDQASSENPSLLDLNDDCVIDIFKYLQYHDLVNLSNTCTRLRAVCVRVCCNKYSEIKMRARIENPLNHTASPNMIEELYLIFIRKDYKGFKDYLNFAGLVGRNFLRIREVRPQRNMEKDVILLLSYTPHELPDGEEPQDIPRAKPREILQEIPPEIPQEEPDTTKNSRKLTKLWLPDIVTNAEVFKYCFTNNPEMQCEYDGSYDQNVMNLLVNLPNLISLRLLRSTDNLHLNAHLFDAIGSFGNLEVLSLDGYFVDNSILEKAVFPLKLKKIKIHLSVVISFNIFTSIIERLQFLEEIDLGQTRIIWYHKKSVYLGTVIDPMLISQIADKFNQRKLNMFVSDPSKELKCFYKSDNLSITNRL